MVENIFGLGYTFSKCSHCGCSIGADGCLMTKDETVTAVKSGTSDFGKFTSIACGSSNHRFKNLRLKENWFSFWVHLLDCPLLCNSQFLCCKFPCKFISNKDHSIRCFLNLLEFLNTIHRIDFSENSYILSGFTQKLSELMDVLITRSKWQSNVIDNDVLRKLTKVVDILVGNRS